MPDIERRKNEREYASALKRLLNEAQLLTLRGLEQFGWELKFIRRVPFQPGPNLAAKRVPFRGRHWRVR